MFTITACESPQKRATIRDLDRVASTDNEQKVFVKPKSDEEIRKAYADYLKNASIKDKSRMAAINRLAEMELALSEKLLQESQANKNGDEQLSDKLYTSRIIKTIDLLTTSLKDYPDSKNNDKLLYQLAKACDQTGQHDEAIDALKQLVKKYPKSPYYIESQFRLGETAFSKRDYLAAEDAYTEVIIARESDIFYEKALFKRGWSRFKQGLYHEALDDFLESVNYHEFTDYDKLNKSEQDQFDEYFRAIGLGFSYLGGPQPLFDYFKTNPQSRYIYRTYLTVADIYLKQERYSDAVDTLQHYNKHHPTSKEVPFASIKIIDIWKSSGFSNQLLKAIDDFYLAYNPDSAYWTQKAQKTDSRNKVAKPLKSYISLVAQHFHNKYQKSQGNSEFNSASLWYSRYIKHYKSEANTDNIYFMYAELLSEHKDNQSALKYYHLAAFDKDNKIINKEAAYACITMTDKLYAVDKTENRNAIRARHIDYANSYFNSYPDDKKSTGIVLHAAELAYHSKDYPSAIKLSLRLNSSVDSKIKLQSNTILSNAYFEQKDYSKAEAAYTAILADLSNKDKEYKDIVDKIALSIYRQAEADRKQGNTTEAINNFVRISKQAPLSPVAATGLYDGIALSMNHSLWQQAISHIESFKRLYPGHKLDNDITKKLSVAYLNSNQDIKAAQEFEKISGFESNPELRKTALWQAAELYEARKDYKAATRSYSDYASKFKKPYAQYMEALNKLVELNTKMENNKQADKWVAEMVTADKKAARKNKTERTRYLASNASLLLARKNYQQFISYRLVEPIKVNLRKKKKAMQAAVKLYGQASTYGIAETATESTHSIAEIYKVFSKSLLESERPKNLNAEELDQYNVLLEDQAFPFEEKAIEFYETNLSHIKDGEYNEWVRKSHARLKELFPVRYNREPKQDLYINVVH